MENRPGEKINGTDAVPNGENQPVMALMIGIQGSGKSEFCRQRLSDGYVRINLDTLKTRNRERLLFLSCLENGENFVVDNTNPTKADRERYIPAAKEHGYRIVGYYMKPHLQESIFAYEYAVSECRNFFQFENPSRNSWQNRQWF